LLHQVGDLFELNVKLRCQKFKVNCFALKSHILSRQTSVSLQLDCSYVRSVAQLRNYTTADSWWHCGIAWSRSTDHIHVTPFYSVYMETFDGLKQYAAECSCCDMETRSRQSFSHSARVWPHSTVLRVLSSRST